MLIYSKIELINIRGEGYRVLILEEGTIWTQSFKKFINITFKVFNF